MQERLSIANPFSIILIAEGALNFTAPIVIIYVLIALGRTRFLHANSYLIAFNAGGLFIIFSGSKMTQIGCVFLSHWNSTSTIFSDLWADVNTIPVEEPLYVWTVFVRTYYLNIGAFSLLAFAIERTCASVFVSDYEKRTRPYIPLSLISIVNSNAVLFTFMRLKEWLSIYYILAIVASANFLALLLFLYSDRKSVNFYLKSISRRQPQRRQHSYSLSERFSNTQNIRIAKLLRKLFVTMFFGCLGIVILNLLAAYFGYNANQHLVFEFFDCSIALGANVFPPIVLLELKALQEELRGNHKFSILEFFLCTVPRKVLPEKLHSPFSDYSDTAVVTPRAFHLRNVLGQPLMPLERETDTHFNQLAQLWK
ncbi:sre G protein-coupled chemoreceptor domain-containing protein [Ditylenchus destructor]|nr:sre G protein-coupled chemoreceptor domain-containing protein [Ditylenchus destructor]